MEQLQSPVLTPSDKAKVKVPQQNSPTVEQSIYKHAVEMMCVRRGFYHNVPTKKTQTPPPLKKTKTNKRRHHSSHLAGNVPFKQYVCRYTVICRNINKRIKKQKVGSFYACASSYVGRGANGGGRRYVRRAAVGEGAII